MEISLVTICLLFGCGLLLGLVIGYLFSLQKSKQSSELLKTQAIGLQAELSQSQFAQEFLQKELEEKKQLAQELKVELTETFKLTSSEILEEKSKKLLELAHMSFKNETDAHEKNSERREQVMQKEFRDLFSQIQTYQTKLNDFEKEREKTLGLVEGQLQNIATTGTYLSQQTQSLKDALSKPNIRGRWGEVQLKNCVELAGMSEFCDVNYQQEFRDEKILRPDMIVKLPGGKRIIVDAKTPMDFYLKYIDETNETLKPQHLEQHAKRLKAHIRELGSKAYNEAVGVESLDYVVMFLPNESFLFAAVEAQKDIVEYALTNKVLITTPPSLVALLRAVHVGWGEYKVAENAKLIYNYSKELHKRLMTFSKGFMSVEQQMERSLETFRKSKNSFERNVLSQARRIESLEGLGDGVSVDYESLETSLNPDLEVES